MILVIVLLCEFMMYFKGTLMQIYIFHYMFGFIEKQYPESFPFLILRILQSFTREAYIFS